MAEFSLIQRYLSQQHHDDSVVLGIGDDAAVIDCPAGYQLLQTIDTMVHNVHFDDHFTAAHLAHKLLHVNLSDIAAMGAEPKWATVALTLPTIDEKWLAEFSATLYQQCREYGVSLIGGDTTSGPLCVSLNLTGIIQRDHYLTRQQAQLGDDIYVSGTLGDAALALHQGEHAEKSLLQRLQQPIARVALGQQLTGVANSCIDLSDGLLADLQHICQQSDCHATLWLEKLPLSTAYQDYTEINRRAYRKNATKPASEQPLDFALNGGDDYELCFTAAKEKRDKIQGIEQELSCKISLIGEVVDEENKRAYQPTTQRIQTLLHGQLYHCSRRGWEHFAG